jgi:hypothetical protein
MRRRAEDRQRLPSQRDDERGRRRRSRRVDVRSARRSPSTLRQRCGWGRRSRCAQCHNHKYDPFTPEDYFRFLAFFANGDFESRTFGDGTRYFEPTLDLATPDQEAARQRAAGQDRSARSGAEESDAGPSVRRRSRWEESIRLGRPCLEVACATDGRRHQWRRAEHTV